MKDKCEWKKLEGQIDNKKRFYPCEKFYPEIMVTTECSLPYCSSCRTTIEKPEPEQPLIVKSGGTYVAYFEGVDLLCMKPNSFNDFPKNYEEFTRQRLDGIWNAIYKRPLTDEIAKLRPMIIHSLTPHQLDMFYGVHNGNAIIYYEDPYQFVDSDYSIDSFNLATAHELQELEK